MATLSCSHRDAHWIGYFNNSKDWTCGSEYGDAAVMSLILDNCGLSTKLNNPFQRHFTPTILVERVHGFLCVVGDERLLGMASVCVCDAWLQQLPTSTLLSLGKPCLDAVGLCIQHKGANTRGEEDHQISVLHHLVWIPAVRYRST